MSTTDSYAADLEKIAAMHDELAAKDDPRGYHDRSAKQLRSMAAAARDPGTPLGKWARSPRVTR